MSVHGSDVAQAGGTWLSRSVWTLAGVSPAQVLLAALGSGEPVPSRAAACCQLGGLRGECLFCRVVLPAYGAGPYLPAIVMERPVYVREMSDGLYSPLTYLLYKVGI